MNEKNNNGMLPFRTVPLSRQASIPQPFLPPLQPYNGKNDNANKNHNEITYGVNELKEVKLRHVEVESIISTDKEPEDSYSRLSGCEKEEEFSDITLKDNEEETGMSTLSNGDYDKTSEETNSVETFPDHQNELDTESTSQRVAVKSDKLADEPEILMSNIPVPNTTVVPVKSVNPSNVPETTVGSMKMDKLTNVPETAAESVKTDKLTNVPETIAPMTTAETLKSDKLMNVPETKMAQETSVTSSPPSSQSRIPYQRRSSMPFYQHKPLTSHSQQDFKSLPPPVSQNKISYPPILPLRMHRPRSLRQLSQLNNSRMLMHRPSLPRLSHYYQPHVNTNMPHPVPQQVNCMTAGHTTMRVQLPPQLSHTQCVEVVDTILEAHSHCQTNGLKFGKMEVASYAKQRGDRERWWKEKRKKIDRTKIKRKKYNYCVIKEEEEKESSAEEDVVVKDMEKVINEFILDVSDDGFESGSRCTEDVTDESLTLFSMSRSEEQQDSLLTLCSQEDYVQKDSIIEKMPSLQIDKALNIHNESSKEGNSDNDCGTSPKPVSGPLSKFSFWKFKPMFSLYKGRKDIIL